LKKKIAIFGSTGSIGRQALDIISDKPDLLEAEVLTANSSYELLIKQAAEYRPNVVVIGEDKHYEKVFDALDPLDIKVYAGKEALIQVCEMDSIDQVLMAIVGFAGLAPTIAAIRNNKAVALANKESLVVAGKIIAEEVKNNAVQIIPVDSELSAIYQCLMGEFNNPIEKIVLTASGGPFRGFTKELMQNITPEEALNHPTWKMGDKVTIDSATLMNKGLEIIEAHWLFGIPADKIEVLIHPQSIVHSLVYFTDGTVKAQMSIPDMRIPIQFALTYPDRQETLISRPEFNKLHQLTFENPDIENFRNLALAFEALEKGGNLPCILNAANEIGVQAFLQDQIGFLGITEMIEHSMDKVVFIPDPTLDEIIETDRQTRLIAEDYLKVK
jgi:1-deoxy-D-xylulose-5-phosphate reductoisomerase